MKIATSLSFVLGFAATTFGETPIVSQVFPSAGSPEQISSDAIEESPALGFANTNTVSVSRGALPTDCPDSSIISQSVHGVDDAWSAGTSTYDSTNAVDYLRADNVYVGSMTAISVYGLQLYNAGSWVECGTDFDFDIRAYDDAGGMPGALSSESLGVTATKYDTGELFAGVYPLMQWDMQFAATNVDWISVQSASTGINCWFLWMSASEGDGNSAISTDGGAWDMTYAFDLAICIDGAPADPCDSPLPLECPTDVDGDSVVAVGDVLAVIGTWGECGDGTFRPAGDVAPLPNGDCCVDVSDVLAVIGSWGEDCLPRGACCYNTGKDPNCSDYMTQADCEANGAFYMGDDSLCATGDCVSGACCIDESTCVDQMAMWACDALGGIFRGSGSACSTVSCTSGCNATGCQPPDLGGYGADGIIGATSDTNPGAGFQAADTFRPTANGVISEVCWWGFYIDFGQSVDCGVDGPGTGDNFTITYYLDDADSTIPGTMFAGPFVVSSSVAPTGDYIPSGIGDIVQYMYSAYHAPVKVQADACYWISIVNETTGDCIWLWETAPAGDERSSQDNGGWGPSDYDFGFCVNVDVAADACVAFVGPCCLPDSSCVIMSAGSCMAVKGTYGGDNLGCADVNNCDPVEGACCFDITTCLDDYFSDDCAAFGATFMGEGTVCADVDCDIQPPGCPDGITFSQPVHTVDDAWTAGTSADDPTYGIYYERAESVYVDSMNTVTVYGLQLIYSGSWGGCDTDYNFNIRAYDDASGSPGAVSTESLNTSVTKTATGEMYAGIYPLMKWDMNFSATNVDWLSIQSASDGLDCWFLWMSSGVGDASSALDDGSGWVVGVDNDFDLSICID